MIIPSYKPGFIFFSVPDTGGGGGVTLYATIDFATSGATSYTLPASVSYIEIELLGGGGGGGGAVNTSSGRNRGANGGGGGGGAGYVKYTYDGSLAPGGFASGDVLNFTIGVAGSPGLPTAPLQSGVSGSAGGTTSFDSHDRGASVYSPSTIAAGGGGGGLASTVRGVASAGGYGGTAIGGDTNIEGLTGGNGQASTTSPYIASSGTGGSGGSHATSDALGFGWGGGRYGYYASAGVLGQAPGTGDTGGGGGGAPGWWDIDGFYQSPAATGGNGMARIKVYTNT